MIKICKFLLVFILIFSMILTYLPYVPQPVADAVIYDARFGYLFGDVNNSSTIDATDALLILQNSVNKIAFDEMQTLLGDVNKNGNIDASDALLILQRSIGKIATFPAGDTYEKPEVSNPGGTQDVFKPVPSSEYLAYKELTETQKSVYDIAYKKISERCTESFSVGSAREVSLVDMMVGVRAVLCDHPELFWAMTNFAYSTANYGNRIVHFFDGNSSTYLYKVENIPQMQATLEAKINQIFAETIKPSMSQPEIALALHNWLVENTTYDHAAVEDEVGHRTSWSAYAALIDGTAICEGLSKAYQLLLYRAGINCGLVTGPGHMWNYVNIDGRWYQTDITWADLDVPNSPLYLFYNQTSEIIAKSRNVDRNLSDISIDELTTIVNSRVISFNYNVPVATSTRANWYIQNGLYFENDAQYLDQINEKIIENALDGKKSIQVMIKDKYFVSGNEVDAYISQIDWSGILWNLPSNLKFSSISRYYKNYGCGFIITWS